MHYKRLRKHGDINRGRGTISERFWAKVDQTEGCWHWLGAVAGKYGRFQIAGRGSPIVQAHRFAYELLVGPIPDGLTIDHLCLNKLCVNPAHLEPVTGLENTRRHLRRVAAGAVPKDRQRNRKETDPSSALSP